MELLNLFTMLAEMYKLMGIWPLACSGIEICISSPPVSTFIIRHFCHFSVQILNLPENNSVHGLR